MASVVHKRSDKASILERIENSGANKVRVGIVDIDGILRGKLMHLDKFRSLGSDGFGFCNVVFGWDLNDVCYDNVSYTGTHTGYPDESAQIDYGTFREVPWEGGLPFFLADFVSDAGKPVEIAPRNLLKKVRGQALDMGYAPIFSQEFEWFNFKQGDEEIEPITDGMFGYSILRATQSSPFFNALFNELEAFGIPLEGLHTETGPGVYEAAIAHDDVLEAADRAALFRSSVKEIAHRFGITPTFMAKWSPELPGCSGHLHQSLLKSGKNVFYDSSGMSDVMKSYLAGILYCMPHIMPMYAPTVNSYKRLVEGFWAPTTVTWGYDNRTAAVRVIQGSEKSSRIELRVTGSDANPYLAMAASLASGLYGIRYGLTLETAPTKSNACENMQLGALPHTLAEATDRMKRSEIAHELFGSTFVTHFLQTRDWEWRQFAGAVTDWEFSRYFEVI